MYDRNILLTGASGFVGSNLFKYLKQKNKKVVGLSRNNNLNFKNYINLDVNLIDDKIFKDNKFNTVIHFAAMNNISKREKNNKSDYIYTNVNGTINLATEAFKSGVNLFIFLSSTKVYSKSRNNKLINENSDTNPKEFYGISKLKAENELKNIATKFNKELVIIRSPMIYGPGVKGNLNFLIKLLKLRIPLPFSRLQNRRSYLAIENLNNFIERCLKQKKGFFSKNDIINIADNNGISTVDLIKKISKVYGLKYLLFPIPISFIKMLGFISNKSEIFESLLSDNQIDISKAREMLNWTPLVNLEKQLSVMMSQNDKFLK